MKLHEIMQVMADNAIPDKDGDVCANGHVMHNLLMNGERIATVGERELFCALHHPECFSLAPRTHIVNDFEVPAPEAEAPENGSGYFTIEFSVEFMSAHYPWQGDSMDERLLSRGLVWTTAEAAAANAKAMLGIDPCAEAF